MQQWKCVQLFEELRGVFFPSKFHLWPVIKEINHNYFFFTTKRNYQVIVWLYFDTLWQYTATNRSHTNRNSIIVWSEWERFGYLILGVIFLFARHIVTVIHIWTIVWCWSIVFGTVLKLQSKCVPLQTDNGFSNICFRLVGKIVKLQRNVKHQRNVT